MEQSEMLGAADVFWEENRQLLFPEQKENEAQPESKQVLNTPPGAQHHHMGPSLV